MEQTTATGTAPAAEVSDFSTDGVLPDNYLDPIESESSTEQVDDPGTQEQTGSQDGQEQAAPPSSLIDQRVAELAKKYGIDINAPGARQALHDLAKTEKRMGDKDAHIAELRSRPKLTQFEEQLLREEENAAEAASPENFQRTASGARDAAKTQTTRAGELRSLIGRDQFQHWRGPEDAVKEFAEAMSEGFEKGDMRKASSVLDGYMARNMLPYMEAFESMMNDGLSRFERERLGDVLPAVRQTAAAQRSDDNRRYAEEQLVADTEFAADLKELRRELTDSVIEFEGKRFPDTLMNRILKEKPWILRAKVTEHPRTGRQLSKDESEVLTYMEQMRAIRSEMSGRIAPTTQAKALIKAGSEIGKREIKERARHGLNGGGSAGPGARKSGADDYVAELENSREKGTRLGDYLP